MISSPTRTPLSPIEGSKTYSNRSAAAPKVHARPMHTNAHARLLVIPYVRTVCPNLTRERAADCADVDQGHREQVHVHVQDPGRLPS